LYGILNAFWEPLTFEMPAVPAGGHAWRRCIDTALPSPDDICPWRDAQQVTDTFYRAAERSVVVLLRPLSR